MTSNVLLAASKSTPLIDWASLAKVAGASAAFGVGIVAVFSVGIYGLALVQDPKSVDAGAPVVARKGGLALAGICFALCAAAVLFGLWLIVPQFH